MNEAERIAIDMIRRYGTREAAIQQAHVCDVEAMTDEERAFGRAVLVELRRCGFPKAAEQLTSLSTLPRKTLAEECAASFDGRSSATAQARTTQALSGFKA
jgi:hypothetical protein